MLENGQALISDEVYHFLCKTLEELGFTNPSIEITGGSKRGDNYLGIIAKAKVESNGKSLSLIVKSATHNEFIRKFAPIDGIYSREIYMYDTVFTTFKKFQEEKGITNPFNCLPKFYGGMMLEKNEALIMKDMKESGFELQNRYETLNYNHVSRILKEYGKLHALSYALRDQKPNLFNELAKNTEDNFFTKCEITEIFLKSIEKECTTAYNTLDPVKDEVVRKKLYNFHENLIQKVQRILKSEAAGTYAVIGHGDCWVNNMLFKYKDPSNRSSPEEICLLDFQLSRLGSPVLDLSYFLFTCADKNLRNKHYDQLIQIYYESLSSFLRQLGSDAEKLIPYSVLLDHLKKFSIFGLYMSTSILRLITSDADEIPDINNLKDEEDALNKFNFESKNTVNYNSRMRGVLLDYVNYGFDI